MLEWIADYRVLRVFDDPARNTTRLEAAAPARLGLGEAEVVVEVVGADPSALAGWLGRWAAAAAVDGHLAVPLEVGPHDGSAFVSRRCGARSGGDPLAAVADAAAAAATLHGVGLVHGSVTPGRIVTTPSGGVLDLPASDPSGAVVAVAPSSGGIDTLAPEMLRGDAATAASDVWSLAACALRVVAGRPAHPRIDHDVLLGAVARVTREAPSTEGVDGPLADLLAGCLSHDPDARPDAAALAAGLRASA